MLHNMSLASLLKALGLAIALSFANAQNHGMWYV